jgi:hypothetical protein
LQENDRVASAIAHEHGNARRLAASTSILKYESYQAALSSL